MSKISCIIVNYNDAGTTQKLLTEIRQYQSLSSVIVVDNCSTDDSVQQLAGLTDDKVKLIVSPENGGYGSGNNQGIRYAVQELGAEYVIIANPDVSFDEGLIRHMKQALQKVSDSAVVSARVKSPEGKELFSCFKVFSAGGDLLDSGLWTRRLFKPFLSYSRRYLKRKNYCLVDAVPGSFFMLRADVFGQTDVFDEQVFLYYEEKILGRRLKDMGKKTILLTGDSYVHTHSVSVDKSVGSILKKQKLLHQSRLYYYQKYCHASGLQMLVARAFLGVVLMEVWFLTEVLKLKY